MTGIDPNARFNLSKANVLLLDGSQHSLEVTGQILRGFGVASVHKSENVEDAEEAVGRKTFELLLIDPSTGDGAGYDFVGRLRRSAGPNCSAPVILLTGHVRARDVSRARDTGANIVVAKPISPSVLLQRIVWVARDKRPFVEVSAYTGPDRRFKFIGPPAGTDGRRESDLTSPLGSAEQPNLSEDEISSFIKPQRVSL